MVSQVNWVELLTSDSSTFNNVLYSLETYDTNLSFPSENEGILSFLRVTLCMNYKNLLIGHFVYRIQLSGTLYRKWLLQYKFEYVENNYDTMHNFLQGKCLPHFSFQKCSPDFSIQNWVLILNWCYETVVWS